MDAPTLAQLRQLRRDALSAARQCHDRETITRAAVDGLEDCYLATVKALGYDPLDAP